MVSHTRMRMNNNRVPFQHRRMKVLRGTGLYLHGELRGRSIGSFFKGLWNGFKSFILPTAKNLIKKHGPSVVKGITTAAAEKLVPAATKAILDKTGASKKTRKAVNKAVGAVSSAAKGAVDKGAQKLIRDTVGSGLYLHGRGMKHIA